MNSLRLLLSNIINDNVQKVFCPWASVMNSFRSIILPLEQEGVRRSRVGVGKCGICVVKLPPLKEPVTGDVHSSPVIEYRDFQIPKKRNSYFSHREMLALTASGLGNPPEREEFLLLTSGDAYTHIQRIRKSTGTRKCCSMCVMETPSEALPLVPLLKEGQF